MGLLDWLRGLFGGSDPDPDQRSPLEETLKLQRDDDLLQPADPDPTEKVPTTEREP